jgi:hypothetical protein
VIAVAVAKVYFVTVYHMPVLAHVIAQMEEALNAAKRQEKKSKLDQSDNYFGIKFLCL